MKKLNTLILGLVSILAISGCGNSKIDTNEIQNQLNTVTAKMGDSVVIQKFTSGDTSKLEPIMSLFSTDFGTEKTLYTKYYDNDNSNDYTVKYERYTDGTVHYSYASNSNIPTHLGYNNGNLLISTDKADNLIAESSIKDDKAALTYLEYGRKTENQTGDFRPYVEIPLNIPETDFNFSLNSININSLFGENPVISISTDSTGSKQNTSISCTKKQLESLATQSGIDPEIIKTIKTFKLNFSDDAISFVVSTDNAEIDYKYTSISPADNSVEDCFKYFYDLSAFTSNNKDSLIEIKDDFMKFVNTLYGAEQGETVGNGETTENENSENGDTETTNNLITEILTDLDNRINQASDTVEQGDITENGETTEPETTENSETTEPEITENTKLTETTDTENQETENENQETPENN